MRLSLLSCSYLLLASTVYAGTMGDQPPVNTTWTMELGERYWLSTNKFVHNLDYGPGYLATGGASGSSSRLTYDKVTGNAAEGFWKLTHATGLFLKGYFGGGSLGGGELRNEDFPNQGNDITAYSNTFSQQKGGSLKYLSADIGYLLLADTKWQLGGFIGYHYWNERLNSFGCDQHGTDSSCSNTLPPFTIVPTVVNVLNMNSTWNSLRIGAQGNIQLYKALNFLVDLAYARSSLKTYDHHTARPSIRPLEYDGTGNGVQLDATLNWNVDRDLSVGAGGRWWYMKTNGTTHFERTPSNGQPQGSDDIQNSYGLILQTRYQFNDIDYLPKTSFVWPGLYVGANLGYGFNTNRISISPTSADASLLQSLALAPSNLNISSSGFLAGGDIGYNWQLKNLVLGAVADLNYTAINGVNAFSGTNLTIPEPNITIDGPNTTAESKLTRLATIRGRVGKLLQSKMLVYVTGGGAFGKVKNIFDQRVAALSCLGNLTCSDSTISKNKTGWTAGAGLEYALNNHATFKAEYLYVDLGALRTQTLDSARKPIVLTGPVTYATQMNLNYNILQLGINYRI